MTAAQQHPATFALQGLITLSNEIEHELARKLGLNLTDYRALSVLAVSGPATVGGLAEHLGATAATTTAIVNRLEARRCVLRQRSDGDRRRVRVSVVPQAYQRIMELMRPLMSATNEHLWSLPAEQQRVLVEFLESTQQQMRGQLRALSAGESS